METSVITSTSISSPAFVVITRNCLYVSTTGNSCAFWMLNDSDNYYKATNAKFYSQIYAYNFGTSDKICFYFHKGSGASWPSTQSFSVSYMAFRR